MKVLILSIVVIILYAIPKLLVSVTPKTYLVINVIAQSLSLYIAYTLLTKKVYAPATAYMLIFLALSIVVAQNIGLPAISPIWCLLDGGCMAIWSLIALREVL
jgi:hypothetical protein